MCKSTFLVIRFMMFLHQFHNSKAFLSKNRILSPSLRHKDNSYCRFISINQSSGKSICFQRFFISRLYATKSSRSSPSPSPKRINNGLKPTQPNSNTKNNIKTLNNNKQEIKKLPIKEPSNSEDSFQELINSHRQSDSPKRLLKALQEMSIHNDFKQEMVILSLRTFQKMNRNDLIPELYPLWLKSLMQLPSLSESEPSLTSSPTFTNNSSNGDGSSDSLASPSSTLDDTDAPTTSTAATATIARPITLNEIALSQFDIRAAALLLREMCRIQRMDLAQQISDYGDAFIDYTIANESNSSDNLSPFLSSSAISDSSSLDAVGVGIKAKSSISSNIQSLIEDNINTTSIIDSKDNIGNTDDNINQSQPSQQNQQLTASYHQQYLSDMALGYTYNNTFSTAIIYLENMRNFNMSVEDEMAKKILKHFIKESDMFYIRKVLRSLLKLGGLQDNDSVQLLSNTFMRSIEFVKGAVSMDTLPVMKHSEVAFIGRSNVGKSSLLNMICNRKGLAYTSKTPGKTSEFNYFDANGRIGRKDEPHQFYLVDLPGVGYAEVKYEKRRSWLNLLKKYVEGRTSLRLLFHLIDSRHGLLDSDNECLDLLQSLPAHVQYVMVLTKADKRGGGMKTEMIYNKLNKKMKMQPYKPRDQQQQDADDHTNSDNIVNILDGSSDNEIINENYNAVTSPDSENVTINTDADILTDSSSTDDVRRKIPILLTSSETKQGGAELWSIMLDAIHGDDAAELFFQNQ